MGVWLGRKEPLLLSDPVDMDQVLEEEEDSIEEEEEEEEEEELL